MRLLSLISVFFSLIKENFNDLNEDFMNLFINKATSIGITTSSSGINGGKLSKLVNDYFFEGEKVCSFNKSNLKQPRITMMYTREHWVGHIPSKKKDILLEPYSGKIFKVEKHLLKEATDTMMDYLKNMYKSKIMDLSINVDKSKLFKFYTRFTKDQPLAVKYNRSLSTIKEGSDERSSVKSTSSRKSRSSRMSRSSRGSKSSMKSKSSRKSRSSMKSKSSRKSRSSRKRTPIKTFTDFVSSLF